MKYSQNSNSYKFKAIFQAKAKDSKNNRLENAMMALAALPISFRNATQLLLLQSRLVKNVRVTKKATLYTDDYLKLDHYQERRKEWLATLENAKSEKETLIFNILHAENESNVSKNEVIQFIKLAETEEDQDILKNIVMTRCQIDSTVTKYIIFLLFDCF